MEKIYYCSKNLVKQILGDFDGEIYDKIEQSKESGIKTSVEASMGSKIKLIFELVFKGHIEANIVEKKITSKNMESYDYGREILNNYDNLNILDHINKDFNKGIRTGYYTFGAICKLEEFLKGNKTHIKVTLGNEFFKINGSTSIENWISESYLNNLLMSEEIYLEGIIKIIDVINNGIDDAIAHFIVIGESGLVC